MYKGVSSILSRSAAEQLGYVAAWNRAKVSCEVINKSVIEVKDTIHTAPLSDSDVYDHEIDTSVKMEYGVKLGSFDDPESGIHTEQRTKSKV
jgi:hypothetical protein